MESLISPRYLFLCGLKTTHIYIPLFPMETMEKQKTLIEVELEIEKKAEPEIKVIKNKYMYAGGLVEEILIRKFYNSKGLPA